MQGWVHHLRTIGKLAFIVLRDRSGTIQAVLDNQPELARQLVEEAVVELEGLVRPEPRAPDGCEVQVERLRVLQQPLELPPIPINRALATSNLKLDTLLDHRVLSLRQPQIHAVFQVQADVIWAFREFLRGQGFTEIHTPKVIATGTEGGTELFPVQYFEQQAYLAQSPQFYKQMMVGAGYERVFEVGPVYRAEPHNTKRHLNEYVSLDVEMGFIEGLPDLLAIENQLLRFMLTHVQQHCQAQLQLLEIELQIPEQIPQVTLAQAAKILQERFGKVVEGDLDPEAERLLCTHAREQLGSEFVFVTHYPQDKRPMYAMPAAQDPQLTESFDLLYKGLEITTGGQRIHEHRMLVDSMRSRGLNPDAFAYYLEVFKHGMPAHGGFAIGAERLTMLMLNLSNVREACLFPRDRTRITP